MKIGHLSALAAAIALLGAKDSIELSPRRKPLRARDIEPNFGRKEQRAASRSKKQYLLKGVRP